MTALCGGGTSGPKFGYSAVVDFSTTVVGAKLLATNWAWAVPIAGLVALSPLVLSTFCGTDPPAIPTFTAAEADALLNLTFGPDLISGTTKFIHLCQHLFWYDVCQCTSGALVALPAASPPPSGVGVPISLSQPSSAPCFTDTSVPISALGTGGNVGGACLIGPYSFPTVANPSVINFTYTITVAGAGPHTTALSLSVLWCDASVNGCNSASYYRTDTYPLVRDGVSHTLNIPWDSAAGGYSLNTHSSPATTDTIATRTQVACGSSPGPAAGCCPPDPAATATLEAILTMVTLIQRQIAPFGYVVGTAHPGLSGNGTIAVSGLLGLKVDLTTTPGRLGSQAGDPVSIWDAGWVNLGTPDGFGPRQFVSSDPTVILPVSGAVTAVGYSIPADVVVTITELVREA